MKITNFICANILSLLGNIGLFVVLSYTYLAFLVYPDYPVDGIIFKLLSICLNTYIYIIPILLVLLPIEDILARKLISKEGFLNIQIKNKYLRYTYNIIFWLGIISAITYSVIVLYVYIPSHIRY